MGTQNVKESLENPLKHYPLAIRILVIYLVSDPSEMGIDFAISTTEANSINDARGKVWQLKAYQICSQSTKHPNFR